MYNALLVFNNIELLDKLKILNVWGEVSDFNIKAVLTRGDEAYDVLKADAFDLVISEIRIIGIDGLALLRRVREEALCSHFVLCSEFPDFNYARQGLILGAYDYIVSPFSEEVLFQIFSRIKEEHSRQEEDILKEGERIASLLKAGDNSAEELIFQNIEDIYKNEKNLIEADKKVCRIYELTIDLFFAQNEWLDLYCSKNEYFAVNEIHEGNAETYKNYYINNLKKIFTFMHEMIPRTTDDQLKAVILYVLSNPEDNLRQSEIADRFYINSTFLSTIFSAKTGLRYADFVTDVKMKRASFKLRYTSIKVAELAELLGYKNVVYFSRLFRKYYGVNPSEYRIPEGLDYQI